MTVDVVVIGAGQAGLAMGYYLHRTSLSYVLLDAEERPGGAWRRTWDSLTLFSPGNASSLPGWLFPPSAGEYPTRSEVLAYLEGYERRYQLHVERPVRVTAVRRDESDRLAIDTDAGSWSARAVMSATGTWGNAVVPDRAHPDQRLRAPSPNRACGSSATATGPAAPPRR